MSTSYTASTSTRPSLHLHPPPSSSSPTHSMKRKRPFVHGGSPAPVYEEDSGEEAVAAESSPPKRGVNPHPNREGLKTYRTTTTAPPLGPPLPTTPLLPRPLSPVAVQETWPVKKQPHEASRPPPETHRPHLPPIPERHHPTSAAPLGGNTSDQGLLSPQRINYSYHPIFDYFRAGRLKEADPDAEDDADEKDVAKTTEAIASERSDNFGVQGHRDRPNFGDGWSPIIPA